MTATTATSTATTIDENDLAMTTTPKKRKKRCEKHAKGSENDSKRIENGSKTAETVQKRFRNGLDRGWLFIKIVPYKNSDTPLHGMLGRQSDGCHTAVGQLADLFLTIVRRRMDGCWTFVELLLSDSSWTSSGWLSDGEWTIIW